MIYMTKEISISDVAGDKSMENTPYDPYDFYNEPTVAWVPPQRQATRGGPKEEPFYEYPGYYAQPGHYTGATQQQAVSAQQEQSADKAARMSKAETLEVADALKKFLVVASIVGFGALGGLAASHVTGATSSQAAPSSSSSSVPSSSAGPQAPSHSDNAGGFFNSDNQGNQGGYQFGSGNSQSPFTSSRSS
jgi:hypothetical protein